MKNAKLELLLNKVVELNQPGVLYCKGFLYKSSTSGGTESYYIKVVENLGTTGQIGQPYYLKDGDEMYITQADKPKLMRVSLKSWHYRLMKWILGSKTPTPQTMQNGCPYYWLVVFSLLVCPFVALWVTVKFLLLLIPKVFFFILEKSVESWINTLDDVSAYEMDNSRYNDEDSGQKLPLTTRALLSYQGEEYNFWGYFLRKKYKTQDPVILQQKSEETRAKWAKMREEIKAEREKREAKEYEKIREYNMKRRKRAGKMELNRQKWDARMKPLRESFSKLFTSIRKLFTFKGDIKTLIKRTKQIMGVLITLIVLFFAFFAVGGLTYVLMCFVDFCIKCWYVFALLAGIAAVSGLLYVIVLFVGGWLQNIVNKYKKGKKVWYIEPLIYLIWYPVKYLALAIAYFGVYALWIPVKFMFYTFLWKIILVHLGIWIWKFLYAVGNVLANSTGIFGEYFNASYTDYCPGIEWVDVEKDKWSGTETL
jgi:hypothetical protein